MDRGGKTWCEVPDDVRLSDRQVDVVSRVSYSFINAGHILDRKHTVLENEEPKLDPMYTNSPKDGLI